MDGNSTAAKTNSMMLMATGTVIVILLIAGILYVLAQNSNNQGNLNATITPTATTTVSETTTPTSTLTITGTGSVTPSVSTSVTPTSSSVTINIQNMQFPSETRIKKGQTVVWVNQDSAAHTVTFSTISVDSGTLSTGAMFSNTFNDAGTFAYKCKFHPSMQSKIIVE